MSDKEKSEESGESEESEEQDDSESEKKEDDNPKENVMKGVKKNGEVRIQGFGTFKASKRKAREGVNPQNPSQKIKIPAMNVVTFKAGSEFKAAVK